MSPTDSTLHRLARAAIALGLACVTACAGTPEIVSCGDADVLTIGREDGLAGDEDGRFKSLAAACDERGAPADPDAYRRGFAEGIREYCTPKGGFSAGHESRKYEGACVGEDEAAFLTAFDMGDRLRRLEAQAEVAQRSLVQARKDRNRNAFSLDVAMSRLRRPNAAGQEIAEAHRDVDYHRGEVERLDEAIPRLAAAAEASRAELAAFETELAASGMIEKAD